MHRKITLSLIGLLLIAGMAASAEPATEPPVFPTDNLTAITSYLAILPDSEDPDAFRAAGLCVNENGTLDDKNQALLDDFLAGDKDKDAAIVFVTFSDAGAAQLNYIARTGGQYHYVLDMTRTGKAGTNYPSGQMKTMQAIESEGRTILVLTDEDALTFEQVTSDSHDTPAYYYIMEYESRAE